MPLVGERHDPNLAARGVEPPLLSALAKGGQAPLSASGDKPHEQAVFRPVGLSFDFVVIQVLLAVCHLLCPPLFLSLSLSVSVSVSLSFPPSPCLYPYVFIYLSASVFLSVSASLSASLCLCCLSASFCLHLPACPPVSALSACQSLPLSVPICICLSLPPSLRS